MKTTPSLFLFFPFLLIHPDCFAQRNSFAFNSGIELNLPTDEYPLYGKPIYKWHPGINAEVTYVHQWKYHFGFEAGLSFRYLKFGDTYPLDTTPLRSDLTGNGYRPYDEKYELFQLGPLINLQYRIKLSRHVQLIPSTGMILYTNFVERNFGHYYKITTSGVTDLGPLKRSFNYTGSENGCAPDAFAIAFNLSCCYLLNKRFTFLGSVAVKDYFTIQKGYSSGNYSFPIQIGIMRNFGRKRLNY